MSAVILEAGEGRAYAMGAIGAVFKADGEETGGRVAVSEWRLDAHREGPGAHLHEENDEIFYVLKGEASLLVGENWHRLKAGGFVFIPRNMMHDFRNESDEEIVLLNVFLPGGFEPMMKPIADWFAEHPPKQI